MIMIVRCFLKTCALPDDGLAFNALMVERGKTFHLDTYLLKPPKARRHTTARSSISGRGFPDFKENLTKLAPVDRRE